MTLEILEQLPALLPLHSFAITGKIPHVKWSASSEWMLAHATLDSTDPFLAQSSSVSVALGWNEEGIVVVCAFDTPFEEAFYPTFSQGDAIELFIDTRDRKEALIATRSCHHFLFLPIPIQGVSAIELTHFRTEESHPLCDPQDLSVKAAFHKKNYTMHIKIPAFCLSGFDPASFDRLGFTYRIHRYKSAPQYFSAHDTHFSLEQHPHFWASFLLTRW